MSCFLPEPSNSFHRPPFPVTSRGERVIVLVNVSLQVNADYRIWAEQSDGSYKMTSVYPDYIGELISTKAKGSTRRVDLTKYYKYREGSVAEAAALGISRNIGEVERCVCVCACVCVCVCHNEKKCQTNGKHDKRHRRYFK